MEAMQMYSACKSQEPWL